MIAYFAHELADPAVQRRVRILKAAGEEVTLLGFERRAYPKQAGAEAPTFVLGRTRSGRLFARVFTVLRAIPRALALRAHWAGADAILARNLEMLAIACTVTALTGVRARIVYECLDVHRAMVSRGLFGWLMRLVERMCLRACDLVLVHAPIYESAYFRAVQRCDRAILVVENKVFDQAGAASVRVRCNAAPWRLAWCGGLRCRASLALLTALVERESAVEVALHGSAAAIEAEFRAVGQMSRLVHWGPFPDEALPRLYGDADFAWTIDCRQAGTNSEMILPNRLYDGLRYGAVPIARAGTETARWLEARGVGVVLEAPLEDTLPAFFATLTPERMEGLRAAVRALPRDTVEMSISEARAIAARITARDAAAPSANVVVVIPCLNEAAHLPRLLDDLASDPRGAAARIVVADGGSTDGSREIVAHFARAHSNVILLDNPGRIQSAGINLAVARYGAGADFIVRMDAHAVYPPDFIERLLVAQSHSGAESVAVAMRTIAPSGGWFQRAAATVQNSVLGTGGSAHRARGRRRFVDHGHHALISRDVFVAAGGYDETFPQNQDAELDARLAARGARILLAGDIAIDYIPREGPSALFRQYFNFGKGRARTMRKHRLRLKLRHIALLLIAPTILAAPFAPLWPWAAAPAGFWLGASLVCGAALGVRAGDIRACGAGAAAAIMHAGWSLGYWTSVAQELLGAQGARRDAEMIGAANEARAPSDG